MIKFVLALLLLLACGALLPRAPQTCEADYYRGVYSFCMVLNAKAVEGGSTRFVNCDELVKDAIDRSWHDREAPGFEWPPAVDASIAVAYD